MKQKQILKVQVKAPDKKKGKWITTQIAGQYLILDIWKDNEYLKRHAMDTETGEYGTYDVKLQEWSGENLLNATEVGGSYWYSGLTEKMCALSKGDKEIIMSATKKSWMNNPYDRIQNMEHEYSSSLSEKKRESKIRRINELMSLCPTPGRAVKDWIAKTATKDLQYAFLRKDTKMWHCTACNKDFPAAGIKAKHREQGTCPLCGQKVTYIKRGDKVTVKTALTMIHNLDSKRGVERFFQVEIEWKDVRTVTMDETIRLMMLREGKNVNKIYYDDGWGSWSEGNRVNRRWKAGYLYPDKESIQAGLAGTNYNAWSDVLPQMAEAGIEADYNRLLVESNKYFVRMTEYLFKGRFYRLLRETSEEVSYYSGYYSILRMAGETIEQVMQLKDRQKINLLRQENGGENMLQWLKWSEEMKKKISTETLRTLEKEGIYEGTYVKSRASKHLTPEQLINYLKRQKKESYPGYKIRSVLEQYEDYLEMSENLGKHMDDEMVYRPRELKRRHDECVEECNRRREELQRKQNAERAKKQAEEMRQKYPGYEDILAEVKEKFEYSNDTYTILVPKDFMEITAEGMALHHCVGNTERYFDRIVSRETYICFLRQQSSPETPFYTIEVEPGGTIRQHRGAFDEEPGIEEIKPFLREWQKVIRKRMSSKDHDYARESAVLRQKNIEELQAKNNTRVLNGLMEDLMEVI